MIRCRSAFPSLSKAGIPLALLIASTTTALGAQATPGLEQRLRALAPRYIEVRQDLHRHPELGNREVRTAALVADELRRLGLEVRTGLAYTGVVGILRGAKPGPIVAIRADMDGLPVTEATDLPFRSTDTVTYLGRPTGVSHACGHDTHVAAQLGVAALLAGMRERLSGTVVFVFQPAEEGAPVGEEGGAELMMKEGALNEPRPDVIFAFHANGDPPDEAGDHELLGHVKYTPGVMSAASTPWRARVIGQQSHGASPHLGVDAIVTASQVVLALQTIRSRNLPPLSANVVTTGVFRGGDRHNIVAGEVELRGTIRTFDDSVLATIKRRMEEIFDGTTRAAGARYELTFDPTYPSVVNDSALVRRYLPVIERAAGKGLVELAPPETGAEDFSYFSREIPAFYLSIGGVPEGKASGGHHTPTFYVDDQLVPVAMRVMSAMVLEGLRGTGR
jgi:amidohydrolase